MKKWTTRLLCTLALAGAVAGTAWAVGTQGSQADPLVTLSYLNESVLPDLLVQVDQKLDEREEELSQLLQEEAGDHTVSFQELSLGKGETVTLGPGTQLLFRSGTAYGTGGLVDTTKGTLLDGSGLLQENHLYLSAGDGQTVTASKASTVLVQGLYQLE